jgi:GNAT superfamily N-acetyltransferase
MTRILAIADAPPKDRALLTERATAIFWATAGSQSFESPAAESAFYRRWFGLYLESEPERFFLALDDGGAVTGYLAACLDSFAAGVQPIVDSIDYYTPAFRAAVSPYPSHFHINVKPGFQGQGVGRRLVARLIESCASAGSCGIHVVTGASSSAVSFYEVCGFRRIAIAAAASGLAVLVAPLSRLEVGET